jgi:hypothetical protein
MPYADPADRLTAAQRRYAASPKWKNQILARKAEYQRRNADYVNRLKAAPCTDCGVSYPPWVMHFDHLGDKDASISSLVKRTVSIARLAAEIAKCEIVCANCHAERTHQRLVAQAGFEPATSRL